MANEIGSKKWGDVYKRVIVVDRSTNTGINGTPVALCDGMGVPTPLLLANNAVGIAGSNPLYFGDATLFFRKKSAGIIEMGGVGRMILPGLSITNALNVASIAANIISVPTISGGLILGTTISGSNIKAESVSAEQVSGKMFSVSTLSAIEVDTPLLKAASAEVGVLQATEMRAKVISAGTIIAASLQQNNVIACNVFANTMVTTPLISTAAVNGAGFESMMVWD